MVRRNVERFHWEQAELKDFVSEIETNDIVYDIGANTGLYTLFAAKKCHKGEVIAFEPYPPNVQLLKKDIERNSLTNVTVIEKALSNSVGSIEFSQPTVADVGYGSSSIQAEKSDSTIDVPTTTGDQLISSTRAPQPNVVKIDVEGAEPLVIEGLADALSQQECRIVYCEVHLPGVSHRPSIEDFSTTVSDIRERFEGFGFTVENLHTRGETELFLKAYR
nr:FkbM family methyltransferase [Haloarchaeobius amylolyticus]